MSLKDQMIQAFTEGSYEVGQSDPNTELGIDAVIHLLGKTVAAGIPKFAPQFHESQYGEPVAEMVPNDDGEWINALALAAILK